MEPSNFVQKWAEKHGHWRFGDALQNLLAEVEEPLTALRRAAETLDRLRFQDALQHLLAEVNKPVTVRQRFGRRLSRSRFGDALQHLRFALRHSSALIRLPFDYLQVWLAKVDMPEIALQRAVVKLPLRFNNSDPNMPYSQRKGSATGDTKRHKVLKRGLSGTIDGLKVSALADTGAAQNIVSSNFARARELNVAGSPSSFRQGNSRLVHSLGMSKNGFDNMTK